MRAVNKKMTSNLLITHSHIVTKTKCATLDALDNASDHLHTKGNNAVCMYALIYKALVHGHVVIEKFETNSNRIPHACSNAIRVLSSPIRNC